MKTLFAFFFTCLFFSETFSQAPVFAMPPEGYVLNRSPNFIKLNNVYVGLKVVSHAKKYGEPNLRSNSISVVNYNNKMVEQGENALFEGKPVFSGFKTELVKGNKIWLVTGDMGNKWGNQGNIRATEINAETYKQGVSKIIVSADELDERGDYWGYKRIIKSSPNLKYHCLFYGYPNDKIFFIACFNSDFDPVWKGKKQIDKTEIYQVSDVSINDEGEIIIVSIAKSIASISKYDIKGSAAHQQINFGMVEPAFIDILESKSGKTYIGGTMFKDSKLENVVFLANLEKDYTVSNIKQLDIAGSILDRLAKDGLAKTGDKKNGLTGKFIHSELVEQGDGKVKLVTETSYADEQSNGYMGFGGLIITNFSNVENPFSLIPKFMVDFNSWPRVNQFVATPSLNNITVFYSDNELNINIDLKERQKPLNGKAVAALYAATVDNNGEIKREIFSTMAKEVKGTAELLIQAYLANKE